MFTKALKRITKALRSAPVKTASHRRATLYEKLAFSAEKFSFTKAMDVANIMSRGKPVEIKSRISFSPRFTDVVAVEGLREGVIEVHTSLNGLAGLGGTIPDCYIEEFVLYNERTGGAVFDFLDMLNERMLTLRYTYMKRMRVPSLSARVEKSVIGKVMLSLSGFSFDEQHEGTSRSLIPEQFKISSQSLFWNNTRSSDGLKIMLRSFFNIPISIRQFVGGFVEVSRDEQTTLGTGSRRRYNFLGKDCILGNKVWDAAKCIDVVVGPLNLENYMKFLPKRTAADQKVSPLQKMKEIVRMYVPKGIDVKLEFRLDKCFVHGTYLTGVNRLNKDSFISGAHDAMAVHFCEVV
ncbi:MAG: type VI secretion system baseplate subunit TssG [Holosporales bacterium]|jgi:type VI secretion system ImpH/TssG family protein|nr:type VI secretion system baseplate subunit TssG [Holosporales bacterium]